MPYRQTTSRIEVSARSQTCEICVSRLILSGRRIPARIDVEAVSCPANIGPFSALTVHSQRLGYIIEVMAQSFQASEHHITLCLRDENDHLVTQSNLALKVKSREVLK
jgi:hypothetical protein